jgi:hypothetical protein
VLPWTINTDTSQAQTIPDGEVHRLRSISKHAFCWRSSEDWLLMIGFASSNHTEVGLFLENPLSGATFPLPGTDNLRHPDAGLYCVTKFIVCPGNLVVARVLSAMPTNRDPQVACCRPGSSSWSSSSQAAAGYEDTLVEKGALVAVRNCH